MKRNRKLNVVFKIKSYDQAFTLIELLVVISIMGLLSSVILATLSGTRERGGVAAGQTFDTHTYSAWNDEITASWNLDTFSTPFFSSGDPVYNTPDISGNGNDLFISNPSILVDNPPNPFSNRGSKSVMIDNANNKRASSIISYNIPDNDYSISFWVYIDNNSSMNLVYSGISSIIIAGEWKFSIQNNNKMTFTANSSTNDSKFVQSESIKIDQWYHILGTCSGNKIAMYINGKQATNSATFSGGNCDYAPSQMYFNGEEITPGPSATYYIDNFNIYKKAFTVAMAEEQYLAGRSEIVDLAMK